MYQKYIMGQVEEQWGYTLTHFEFHLYTIKILRYINLWLIKLKLYTQHIYLLMACIEYDIKATCIVNLY